MISLPRTGRRAAAIVRLFRRGDWRLLAYKLQIRVRGLDLRPTSLEELGLSPERSVEHWNSGGPGLETVLRELQIQPLITREIVQDGCRWIYHVFRHCRQMPLPGASSDTGLCLTGVEPGASPA